MGIYDNMALGLDLSHYDAKVDAAQLEGNVDFLTIKAGGTDWPMTHYLDARFAERVQMAYDIGALCGAYWFVGPRYWLEWDGGTGMSMKTIDGMTDDEHPLLKVIMNQLKNKLIYWLAFDVERNSLPTNFGTVTDVWIKYYVADLIERLQRQQAKGNIRPFKMGVYSSRSFMDGAQDGLFPQTSLSTYLGVQPNVFIWTANWVTGTGATLTMEQVKALRPNDLHLAKSFGYCPDRQKTWQFFQWSGDNGRIYRSPAITNDKDQPRGLDINLFNGSLADLKAWAGITTDTGGDSGGDTGGTTQPGDPDTAAALARIEAKLDKLAWLGK